MNKKSEVRSQKPVKRPGSALRGWLLASDFWDRLVP